jgi:hypothetical protein
MQDSAAGRREAPEAHADNVIFKLAMRGRSRTTPLLVIADKNVVSSAVGHDRIFDRTLPPLSGL